MPCNVSPEEAEAFGEGLITLVSLDCSWPLHCPISRKEGCTTLHVAVDKEGAMMDGVPSFRGAPFLPNIGPLVLGSGSCAPPCGPFGHLAQLVPTGHCSFRLLLKENTFQALS